MKSGSQLPHLHMDHTHDVKYVCHVWSEALPKQPHPCKWDDGICGAKLAHLLFGTADHVRAEQEPECPL